MNTRHVLNKGVTLIELLLYISMVSIVIGSSVVLLFTVQNASTKNESLYTVENHGNFVMETITQAIRLATSTTGLAQGATSSTLTLVMEDTTRNPTIFSISSSSVSIQEGVQSPVSLLPISIGASQLEFINTSQSATTSVIEVSLSLYRISSSTRNEYSYSADFFGVASIRK